MNINDAYFTSINPISTSTTDKTGTTGKSLADYMNESDSGTSTSSYFSDTVSLSKEAYAAIREYNPTMLKSLGYIEEESTAADGSSTSSRLDSVQFSKEAYAALKERNPEFLKSLGYDLDEI